MQARAEAVCPIRQFLFNQVFDEIIRQVTINCPERGITLMRVRDERKMTIAAYETVYKKAIEYGIKKQIESE
jgi:dynein light intermediate chain